MSTRTQPAPFEPRTGWRTIDIVTSAMIGVVLGVVYWAWSASYAFLSGGLDKLLGPSVGLLGGPWLLAGVIAGLVVRRPGAALFAETLAAVVEALLGNEWGWQTLYSGVLQGLGVELALAIFLYRRFSVEVAVLAGILAAAFEWGYEMTNWLRGLTPTFWFEYLAFFALSGGIVAGVGGWLLTRALSATGAIDALPAGQEWARYHSV